MNRSLRKFEEDCKEKFDDGSFGILTPIFNPAYPSLKYVIPIFLLIRTIFYICTFVFNDSCIHLEYFVVLVAIYLSISINRYLDTSYTVESELMGTLMHLIGLTIFITLLTASCGLWEDISSSYYILFAIDLIFFFYTIYIGIKEMIYNADPKKYLYKYDTKRIEYNKFYNIIDETGHLCEHIFDDLDTDEKSILEEHFNNIKELYHSSYKYRLDIIINDVNVFLETSEFIKSLSEVMEAYKKTKPCKNLEYLEKVRDSMKDFCETIINRNENIIKEKFNGAIEELKIRVERI